MAAPIGIDICDTKLVFNGKIRIFGVNIFGVKLWQDFEELLTLLHLEALDDAHRRFTWRHPMTPVFTTFKFRALVTLAYGKFATAPPIINL
jgi:hypothetical protein